MTKTIDSFVAKTARFESMVNLSIDQVQRYFSSPLSESEVALYQARLDVAKDIDWKNKAFYAIGDPDEFVGLYGLYECLIEDGMVLLGQENACGEVLDYHPVFFVLYAGCVVVPQG